MTMRRKAAENIAGNGQNVSIEPDGTCWIGTENNKTYILEAEIIKEMSRLEKELTAKEKTEKANTEAAIAHDKSLGFTDEMIAVMYPALITP